MVGMVDYLFQTVHLITLMLSPCGIWRVMNTWNNTFQMLAGTCFEITMDFFFFLSYCMLKCKTFEGFLDYVVHDCGVRSQQKLASNSSIILFAVPLWDHYVLLNWCILMCRILIWLLIQSLITVLLSSQGHQCHHHNLHRLLRRIIIPTHRILV